MQLNANQAFYLLVNNKSIASMSTSMAEIYRDDKVSKKQIFIL
jgi:microtubule-associated protein 1 light chain